MGSYILNFTVYTMAMCGLIFFALFVYKIFANGGIYSKKSIFLNIEDTLSIGPRKTLYVVKAGNEKFLIASDTDKTSLISKLETATVSEFEIQMQNAQLKKQNFSNSISSPEQKPPVPIENYKVSPDFKGIDELPQIVEITKKKNARKSENVIKSMISKVKE